MKKYKLLTQEGYFHFTKGQMYKHDSFGDYENSELPAEELAEKFPDDWEVIDV